MEGNSFHESKEDTQPTNQPHRLFHLAIVGGYWMNLFIVGPNSVFIIYITKFRYDDDNEKTVSTEREPCMEAPHW